MEARNRVGIGLSYRPARLQRLAESIYSLESFLGRLKSLKIRALVLSHIFEDDVTVCFPPILFSFTVNQVYGGNVILPSGPCTI